LLAVHVTPPSHDNCTQKRGEPLALSTFEFSRIASL
jgi:hypothetical protein